MDDMNSEFFAESEKVFCDNAKVAFNPEAFLFALASGEERIVFALTPKHTKRLMQHLGHMVAKYEEANGEIETQWSPNILSPIQVDLGHDTPDETPGAGQGGEKEGQKNEDDEADNKNTQ